MKTAKEYMERVRQSTLVNYSNLREIYKGEEGSKRFAREFGYGLNDFPVTEHKEILSSSYSFLCVRFYDLKPPIDAKTWNNEIISQLKTV